MRQFKGFRFLLRMRADRGPCINILGLIMQIKAPTNEKEFCAQFFVARFIGSAEFLTG
jgi:ABC-type sugar transport system ATPase subunit